MRELIFKNGVNSNLYSGIPGIYAVLWLGADFFDGNLGVGDIIDPFWTMKNRDSSYSWIMGDEEAFQGIAQLVFHCLFRQNYRIFGIFCFSIFLTAVHRGMPDRN
jgi:hypothetical protein